MNKRKIIAKKCITLQLFELSKKNSNYEKFRVPLLLKSTFLLSKVPYLFCKKI